MVSKTSLGRSAGKKAKRSESQERRASAQTTILTRGRRSRAARARRPDGRPRARPSTRLAVIGRGTREEQEPTKVVAAARSYPGRSRGRPDAPPTPLTPFSV